LKKRPLAYRRTRQTTKDDRLSYGNWPVFHPRAPLKKRPFAYRRTRQTTKNDGLSYGNWPVFHPPACEPRPSSGPWLITCRRQKTMVYRTGTGRLSSRAREPRANGRRLIHRRPQKTMVCPTGRRAVCHLTWSDLKMVFTLSCALSFLRWIEALDVWRSRAGPPLPIFPSRKVAPIRLVTTSTSE
jgi:hypothetical protein